LIYLASYTAGMTFFMYMLYTKLFCGWTTGGVWLYYDQLSSYLCGNTAGYTTQLHYTVVFIFTYAHIIVQGGYWLEQFYVNYL
jgi:hypothetical protein